MVYVKTSPVTGDIKHEFMCTYGTDQSFLALKGWVFPQDSSLVFLKHYWLLSCDFFKNDTNMHTYSVILDHFWILAKKMNIYCLKESRMQYFLNLCLKFIFAIILYILIVLSLYISLFLKSSVKSYNNLFISSVRNSWVPNCDKRILCYFDYRLLNFPFA